MNEYYLLFFRECYAQRVWWAPTLCMQQSASAIIRINGDEVVAVKMAKYLSHEHVAEYLAIASLPAAFIMLKYPQIPVKSSPTTDD